MANPITLIGLSGPQYVYHVYTPEGDWADSPGNYAFVYQDRQGVWRILYIGQCDSFRDRMPPRHERWDEAMRHGATHILAHINQGGESARLAEERDLIRAYCPPMNTQHQPEPVGLLGLG